MGVVGRLRHENVAALPMGLDEVKSGNAVQFSSAEYFVWEWR